MRIRKLFLDIITEDLNYEYKDLLNPDNPVKWAKTIIGFANDRGKTGFQTMIEAYIDSPIDIQPVVSIYPGF